MRLAVIAALASLTTPAHAQTARPGGNARGTTGRATTTTSRTSTTGGASAGPRQYRSNTLLGDATIQIDPETRSLIVVTDEATHSELEKVIQDLDRPKPQVLINVVFVEVTYNKGYDVGVEANYIFRQDSPATGAGTNTTNVVSTATSGTTTTTTTTNNALAVAAQAAQAISSGSNFGLAGLTDGTFVRVLTDDWAVTLRALATRGKVEVLSRPSIMARNNQEAVIVVGQEVPFITNSRTDSLGQTINTIQYDNVGIILRVTPFISAEKTVEMIVAPEISTLNTTQTVPISNTVNAPTIDKRSAETVVVTPDGRTVVIGGLMQTLRTETIQKVPLLGDIPILGFPFRRTVKDDRKRELLIFLTPHIVNGPAAIQRVTNEELNRAEGVSDAFSDKEFERYLETRPSMEEPLAEPTLLIDGKETRRATLVKPL